MCRINGILQKNISESVLLKMRESLEHGGPDDSGIYINESKSVGLCQRRLSVIDLSVAGHQPMKWGKYVVVFNGEIYNYIEIKKQLEIFGYSFNSNSDTEVLIKAFDKWGYDCVNRFRGMFAFAIWNTETRKLLLCRDRVGVKPLYWYLKGGLFMFSSELKAFHEHPEFDKSINQEAVSLFLQTGYIRSPYCIFQYAEKLSPGSFLEIDGSYEYKLWKYWNPRDYTNNLMDSFSEDEVINQCESTLTEAFKLRMVADVPVGMFLSGGIDSSLVTALLQKDSKIPLNTFTIGFEDPKLNEADFAKKVASYLGTNHTELYCKESDFTEIINELPDIYDEPFGDSSGIPTFLVARLARQSVTVSLSADGGDELFTGYNRYLFAENLFSKFDKIPNFLKEPLSDLVGNISVKTAQKIIKKLPINEDYKRNIDARLPKLQEILKAKSHLDFLYSSTIFITPKHLKTLHRNENIPLIFDKGIQTEVGNRFAGYGIADIESYLEGDILCKVDRATMRVALEGREPFLDNKVIELALGLPDHFKIRNGKTKWILREILYKYVPKELIERPKMGFGIPLDNWLSTMLINDLNDIKHDKDFVSIFNLDKDEIVKLIDSYLNKKSFSPYFIWYMYCLYKWYKRWLKK